MANFKVAIVGKPNVGKSTIFNRVIKQRKSIIDDMPGVTRDRLYERAEWQGVEFILIDTGGIELDEKDFNAEIKLQATLAIEEADVIVFLSDATVPISKEELFIAALLRKSKKDVILAVNKCDNDKLRENLFDFYELGFGEPMALATIHGVGVGDLLDRIIEEGSKVKRKKPISENAIKFCLVGRPNVGKSSIFNKLIGKERVIVSDIEGTTRDSIDYEFTRDGKEYVMIDTAGIRKRGKVVESVERYSVLRSRDAIEQSDVACIVIDASTGIREQDKKVAGYAFDAKKGVVIIVNKWDLIEKDYSTFSDYEKLLKEEFQFIDYAIPLITSAETGQRIGSLLEKIDFAYENYSKKLSTSVLNEIVNEAFLFKPPATFNGGQLKIYYATQPESKPPTFVFFVNDPEYLHFSYKRYLENQLRKAFGFEGTTINLVFRKRS